MIDISFWFLQDNYSVQSFERGIAAQEAGAFAWEIVPVEVSGGRGRPSTIVDKDEGLGKVIVVSICFSLLIFMCIHVSQLSAFEHTDLKNHILPTNILH